MTPIEDRLHLVWEKPVLQLTGNMKQTGPVRIRIPDYREPRG
jgi:hypothetical protein